MREGFALVLLAWCLWGDGGIGVNERRHTFPTLHKPIIQQRRDAEPDIGEIIMKLEAQLLAQSLILFTTLCQEVEVIRGILALQILLL